MSNKKIVFCGCGPMGEGILGGLLNNNVAKAKDVTVNELLEVRRTYITETYGVAAVENASDALKAADPGHHRGEPRADAQGCPDDPPLIKKACIVMSIACGVSLGTLAGMLGDDKKILRVTPNAHQVRQRLQRRLRQPQHRRGGQEAHHRRAQRAGPDDVRHRGHVRDVYRVLLHGPDLAV